MLNFIKSHLAVIAEVCTFAEVMKKILTTLLCALMAAAIAAPAADLPFVNHGRAPRFIDFEAHGLIGASTVTHNYQSCFPQISQMALTSGMAGGLGAGARTWFSDFIALGMEFNFLVNHYNNNLAVADDDATSITNVFVRNRFYTLNFPVYVTFNFNVSPNIRWTIDAGGYYAYGLTGRSRTTFYSAQVNPVGQLITTVTGHRTDFYNSPETFIVSSYRGDAGLHIATGLTFRRLISIGLRMEMGVKNIAHAYNAVRTPNVHNFSALATLGWCF